MHKLYIYHFHRLLATFPPVVSYIHIDREKTFIDSDWTIEPTAEKVLVLIIYKHFFFL